ncbi:hypothetical protein HK104_000210 [Borealophlyctis nickersoniae]|nr:hypothetical protein HK104_000210 [Borealophlyctis nickersoniae]
MYVLLSPLAVVPSCQSLLCVLTQVLRCALFPLQRNEDSSPTGSFSNLRVLAALPKPPSIASSLANSEKSIRRASGSFQKFLSPNGAKTTPPAASSSERSLPSQVTLALGEHVRDVFQLGQAEYEAARDKILQSYGPELIAGDLTSYLSLLDQDLGFTLPKEFEDQAQYEQWKAIERQSVERLLHLAKGQTADHSLHSTETGDGVVLISFTVEEARGLLAKDKGGSSNPYCAVNACGKTFASDVITRNLNPIWQLRMSLTLSPSSDPIVITVWNRTSDAQKKGPLSKSDDAFLGMITIPASAILSGTSAGPLDVWYPLLKRSPRSNVAGDVRITAHAVSKDTASSSTPGGLFHAIPPDPKSYYETLLNCVLNYDIAHYEGGPLLTAQSKTLLGEAATVWRLTSSFRAMVLYDALASLYAQGVIPVEVLLKEGFSKAQQQMRDARLLQKSDMERYRQTSTTLSTLLTHQIGTFFNHTVTPQTAKQLQCMIQIFEELNLDPALANEQRDSRNATKRLLEARYHGLHAIANAAGEPASFALVELVRSVTKELQLYNSQLDTMFLGYIHVPSMAARLFFGRLTPQLDSFANTYVAAAPDLADAFELYHAVRVLQDLFESIDYRLAEKFKVENWFLPFVMNWLDMLEKKMPEWVRNAIKVDTFAPSSPTVMYSTSILDIFASFQQQVDVLMQLNWPDPSQGQIFVDLLLEYMISALERYCDILSRLVVTDLDNFRNGSAQPGTGPKENSGAGGTRKKKLKFSMKKLGKSKGSEIDLKEIRFPPQACVRLNDIDVVPTFFDNLRIKDVIPAATAPTPSQPQKLPRNLAFLLRITIQNVENFPPTRPYTTTLSCTILTSPALGSRELARTRRVRQRVDARWNETLHCVVSEREFGEGLEVAVIQHVPGRGEYVFVRGAMGVGRIGNIEVGLGTYGVVNVHVEFEHGSALDFLRQRVRWMVGRHEKMITDQFADKLCHDLRSRLKQHSQKHKAAPLAKAKNFMTKLRPDSMIINNSNSNIPTPSPTTPSDTSSVHSFSSNQSTARHLTLLTEAEVDQDLSDIWAHLEANLETLIDNMEHRLALSVARGLWDRVLEVVEGLLVPGLGEEDKEVKALDERRVSWCRWAIEILSTYFNGEGEGIPFPDLHTPRFLQLRAITDSYFSSRKELEAKYMLLLAERGEDDGGADGRDDDAEQPEPSDWVLKLIKLKGGKEFVEAKMRAKCTGRRM